MCKSKTMNGTVAKLTVAVQSDIAGEININH